MVSILGNKKERALYKTLPFILLLIMALLLPTQYIMASTASYSLSSTHLVHLEKLASDSSGSEHSVASCQIECSGTHCASVLVKLPAKLAVYPIKPVFLLSYRFALNNKHPSSLFRPPRL